MNGRTYGQYCGLAKAMEIIGERWAMLVVRDLILGPKRYSDLRETLRRIPLSILSSRLNELEEAGVIRRRVLSDLDAAVIYELTEYGSELEPIVMQLGLWGVRSLGEPGDGDLFTMDSTILALYTLFRPEAATDLRMSFELRCGDTVVHAIVDNGTIKAEAGPCPGADLLISATGPLKALLCGEIRAAEAVRQGTVWIAGDYVLLERFVDLFPMPPAPVVPAGLAVR